MKLFWAVVLVFAAVLALPGAAVASTKSLADPSGDASFYNWDGDDLSDGSWGLDLSGLQVSVSAKTVSGVMHFYRLGKTAWDDTELYVRNGGPGAPLYRIELDRGEQAHVYRGRFGFRPTCAATSRVDYAGRTITLSAAASCFGSPTSVQPAAAINWTCHEVEGSTCCDSYASDVMPSFSGFLAPVPRS